MRRELRKKFVYGLALTILSTSVPVMAENTVNTTKAENISTLDSVATLQSDGKILVNVPVYDEDTYNNYETAKVTIKNTGMYRFTIDGNNDDQYTIGMSTKVKVDDEDMYAHTFGFRDMPISREVQYNYLKQYGFIEYAGECEIALFSDSSNHLANCNVIIEEIPLKETKLLYSKNAISNQGLGFKGLLYLYEDGFFDYARNLEGEGCLDWSYATIKEIEYRSVFENDRENNIKPGTYNLSVYDTRYCEEEAIDRNETVSVYSFSDYPVSGVFTNSSGSLDRSENGITKKYVFTPTYSGIYQFDTRDSNHLWIYDSNYKKYDSYDYEGGYTKYFDEDLNDYCYDSDGCTYYKFEKGKTYNLFVEYWDDYETRLFCWDYDKNSPECNKNINYKIVSYSDGNPHNPLNKVAKKEATCTQAGNKEYWACSHCDKIFSDEEGNNEITQDDIILKAKGHNYKEIYVKATLDKDGYKASCIL